MGIHRVYDHPTSFATVAYGGPDGYIDLADLADLFHRRAFHADAACREHPEIDYFPPWEHPRNRPKRCAPAASHERNAPPARSSTPSITAYGTDCPNVTAAGPVPVTRRSRHRRVAASENDKTGHGRALGCAVAP
jgi:hypothetical protein